MVCGSAGNGPPGRPRIPAAPSSREGHDGAGITQPGQA